MNIFQSNTGAEIPLAKTSQSGRVGARTIRRWTDKVATGIVTLGGLATILSILGIFVYLFIEVVPLFYSASATKEASVSVKAEGLANGLPSQVGVGLDEYMEVGYVIHGGNIALFHVDSGKSITIDSSLNLENESITSVGRSGAEGNVYGLGTADGQVIPLTIDFKVRFLDGVRSIQPELSTGNPLEVSVESEPIRQLAYRELRDGGSVSAVVSDNGKVQLLKMIEEEGGLFSAEVEQILTRGQLPMESSAPPTAMLLDGMGETLVVGSEKGELLYWDITSVESPRLMGVYQAAPFSEGTVTALSYLIGDRSFVVGTSEGKVSVWMPFVDPDKGGDSRLSEVRAFSQHEGAITSISPSQRDKGFLTADVIGSVFLHHSTSGQTLAQIPGAGRPVQALMFSPKGDGVIFADRSGKIMTYRIENEHPETTIASIFTPVLYEGYDQPHHIWQSSSGSDDFEPKFGLWPLIFGTLKGTFYAMLLATPLAVLGAIYTAMFMHPDLRSVVKPVVEIMEALPTVVLGFLAGLWLAPLLEKIFPAVVGMFLIVPIALLCMCLFWQILPAWIRRGSGSTTEFLAFGIVLLGSLWLCISFNTQIESWLFHGNYKDWLSSTLGLAYDQRNAMVIAFAMGMAVIPTIYSISEDSISNVPRHLIAGSLALGATPWQTLTKLVIVSASPGLFSALMIGLGRVVGETMIVLMATGNTPVMDMNLFNGFRTLSANIAVEMPEAPEGGTLFRLLFLAGLILFAFTSVVNTIAEVIRQRLRAKYSQY